VKAAEAARVGAEQRLETLTNEVCLDPPVASDHDTSYCFAKSVLDSPGIQTQVTQVEGEVVGTMLKSEQALRSKLLDEQEHMLKSEQALRNQLLDEQEQALTAVMHEEIEGVRQEMKAKADAQVKEMKAAQRDIQANADARVKEAEEMQREIQAQVKETKAAQRDIQANADARVKEAEEMQREIQAQVKAQVKETEAAAQKRETTLEIQVAAERSLVSVQPHPPSSPAPTAARNEARPPSHALKSD
jgi:hypothetical protein